MDFSEDQERAIAAVVDWFRNGRYKQQVFRLFGPAGSGKTTLVNPIIDALGLSFMRLGHDGGISGTVVAGAYSGKAAHVLNTKGVPARTIHSLIYSPDPENEERIKELNKLVKEYKKAIKDNPELSGKLTPKLEDTRRLLAELIQPKFSIKRSGFDESAPRTEVDIRLAELVVLDEVSMIDDGMCRDLMAYEIPVLVLGDPYQLPPIGEGGALTNQAADFLLTKIHRQAEGNPILALSQRVRMGERITPGQFGDAVFITDKRARADEIVGWADKVICGTNATKRQWNHSFRRALGHKTKFPESDEEQIICVSNFRPQGKGTKIEFFNGQDIFVNGLDVAQGYESVTAYGNVRADKTSEGVRRDVYLGHFENAVMYDQDRLNRDYFNRLGTLELDWAYALTCHKAQGSEWRNVIVQVDSWGRSASDRSRWLYTAITRAKEKLGIILT